ncbi:MAG TPA: hypothetical protein VIV11_43140 [Kofleriaceae bacterium]
MAAGRKKKATKQPANKPKPRTPAAPITPAVEPARRDVRPYIYLGLNQLFVIIYFYVLTYVIPNRLMSATIHLWALPVLMQVMALGMATRLVRSPKVQRWGWWAATIAASLLVLITILLIIRVLVSAAFLSGVYGAFGKAAAMSALIGVALVVELVALLPLFQIKYLMTRSGRRAYAFA